MNKRHNHADVIIAWAEGKPIQWRFIKWPSEWQDLSLNENSEFNNTNIEYRIKPEHKPDIRARLWSNDSTNFHLVFVFDGETKEFKTVEYHDE